jgi:hypothetical protein
MGSLEEVETRRIDVYEDVSPGDFGHRGIIGPGLRQLMTSS